MDEKTTAVVKSNGTAQLAVINIADVMHIGQVFAQSGFFADCRGAAQAVVKIMAGRELGFGPMASMTGVHVIEGKPSVGSHLLAAAIRGSGRYDYEVLEHTDLVCVIKFKRRVGNGWQDLLPVERVTIEEATLKGWTVSAGGKQKAPWFKTPKNMLFARAITNGHKFHAPDLFAGLLVYEPDEFDQNPEPLPPPPANNSPALNGRHVEQQAPAAPENPVPNPEAPQQGPLTEADIQELRTIAKQHQRTQGDVKLILLALGVRELKDAPRERMTWIASALAQGLTSTEQADRIAALVSQLGIDPPSFKARLLARFQATALAYLLPSQATEVEQSLLAKVKPLTPAA